MFKQIVVGLLFLIHVQLGHAQSDEKYAFAIEEANRIIDSLVGAQKIPGLDIAISIKGKTVWSQAFGKADLELNVPVSAGQTVFRIGSVSKPLTATAIGILYEQKKVELDSNALKYVAYFPKKKYPFTVRQLAGHTAGIRNYKGNEFLSNKRYTDVRSGLKMFQDDTLKFKPGTKYAYTSHGYNLLSAVVEGASKKDFLSFMQTNIFDPLEMTSTYPDYTEKIILNRTSFYKLDSTKQVIHAPFVDNSYKWGGGGFISTTTDLLKFGNSYLDATLLKKKTIEEFTKTQYLKSGTATDYGIGWSVINSNGRVGYGHSGSSVGGITAFEIYPKEKLVIVILTNFSDTNYGNVVSRIVSLFAEAEK
jgi:serine beta-lactamase-like protein LACTB, mitochondrial